jgi:glycosyltransferase involved in cell wall biosynthesis
MISFVIPVFNEKESLQAFYKELKKEITKLGEKYEIIFVDDGSTDTSLEILKALARDDKLIRIFSFRTNLGKSEALTCGFLHAKGDYVITMDADLQDRPSEIHKLLTKAKEGVEVVCGWRKERKDKSQMKIISQMFNRIVGYLFNLHLHDYNCGLKLYTKDAAKSLRLYGGLHRFIPLLAFEQGFVVDEVAVEHAPRKFGHSKYGFSKLWKDLPDLFTMFFLAKYGKRPLHFFGTIGGVVLLIGSLIFIYLAAIWLQGESIGRRPLFFASILLILGGLQIFFTGFLADLMINISQRPRSLDGSTHFPLKYKSDKEQS